MQKQHSSPQRHREHRGGLIFSNREMPIGEKIRCHSPPSDLWHITIKQYHYSTMGCKGVIGTYGNSGIFCLSVSPDRQRIR